MLPGCSSIWSTLNCETAISVLDAENHMLQIHKAGKKQREHIAAEPAPKAIANV